MCKTLLEKEGYDCKQNNDQLRNIVQYGKMWTSRHVYKLRLCIKQRAPNTDQEHKNRLPFSSPWWLRAFVIRLNRPPKHIRDILLEANAGLACARTYVGAHDFISLEIPHSISAECCWPPCHGLDGSRFGDSTSKCCSMREQKGNKRGNE